MSLHLHRISLHPLSFPPRSVSECQQVGSLREQVDGLLPHSLTLDSHCLQDPVISDFIQSLYDLLLTTYFQAAVF